MSWDGDDWIGLKDAIDNDQLPEKRGAYVIRCAPRGRPKSIRRAFDVDKTGVLCFGMTASSEGLKGRLTIFYGAAGGGAAAHAEGQRYHCLGYHQHGFCLQSLQVRWVECATKKEAKEQELCWFDKYAMLFGELPPLNRRRG